MTIVARSLATLTEAKSSLQSERQDVSINAVQADVTVQSSLDDAAAQAEQVGRGGVHEKKSCATASRVCPSSLLSFVASRCLGRFLFSSARREYRSQLCWRPWSRPSLRGSCKAPSWLSRRDSHPHTKEQQLECQLCCSLRGRKVNWLGVVHSIKATLPSMKRAGWGDIVLVSSLAGQVDE